MLEQLELGLATTFISMAIVFLVLIGLSYLIRLQKVIVEKIEGTKEVKKAPEVPKAAETVKPAEETEDSEELVAVITAAVAAVLGRPTSTIKVKSIRGLDSAAPSWAVAGRQDQIGSRF